MLLRATELLCATTVTFLLASAGIAFADCEFTRKIAQDYSKQCKATGNCKYENDYKKLLLDECGVDKIEDPIHEQPGEAMDQDAHKPPADLRSISCQKLIRIRDE